MYLQIVIISLPPSIPVVGYRSLSEVIGRPGLLRPRTGLQLKKSPQGIDVSYLLDSLTCNPEKDDNFCEVDEDR